jgi:hypothetical protein
MCALKVMILTFDLVSIRNAEKNVDIPAFFNPGKADSDDEMTTLKYTIDDATLISRPCWHSPGIFLIVFCNLCAH